MPGEKLNPNKNIKNAEVIDEMYREKDPLCQTYIVSGVFNLKKKDIR